MTEQTEDRPDNVVDFRTKVIKRTTDLADLFEVMIRGGKELFIPYVDTETQDFKFLPVTVDFIQGMRKSVRATYEDLVDSYPPTDEDRQGGDIHGR